WSSQNTTSCSASGGWNGNKSLSGTQSVSPTETTAYAISCTGDNGTISGTVTITVTDTPPPPPPPAVEISFSANPTAIDKGQSSALTWNVNNATSCARSGGWSGSAGLSGTQSVSPSATTTYVLSCTG